MKANSHTIKLSVLALAVCGVNAGAADWVQRSYLNADLGVSFIQDVTIKNSLGAKATFDPGVAAIFCLGYHLNDSWAAEFETGVMWNSIDKVTALSVSSLNAGGDLYQIPFKLNLIYNVPTKNSWTPYFGVGAGCMASILHGNARDVSPAPVIASPNFGSGEFNDTDFTFAYQAIAGLKYKISERAQVDLGYKFFGTLDHSWSDNGVTFKTEGIYTHAVLLSFTWKF